MTAHYDGPKWKEDWDTVRKHYEGWWERQDSVLYVYSPSPAPEDRAGIRQPVAPKSPRQLHTDPDWFAANQRYLLSQASYPADNLPIAFTDYGCVQLAAYFGSEPNFTNGTVWYEDCIKVPEGSPRLSLTKSEPWWVTYRQVMERVYEISEGEYLVGMPAFGSNLDVLAELRGTQNLLYDLIERGDWVKEKLEEINSAFFVAFDDYYDLIQLADGSSAYTYYNLWGPGKVSQVQCDFSAMISPDMFAEFVVPPIQKQCAWLDHSMFHLDGPSCICHLEHLLEIPELDAIQWCPGAGQPGPGDTKWYSIYERILAAGKSVQVGGMDMGIEQARRFIKTFGTKGVFLCVNVNSDAEASDLINLVDSRR